MATTDDDDYLSLNFYLKTTSKQITLNILCKFAFIIGNASYFVIAFCSNMYVSIE